MKGLVKSLLNSTNGPSKNVVKKESKNKTYS